jgi:hypothetical protein
MVCTGYVTPTVVVPFHGIVPCRCSQESESAGAVEQLLQDEVRAYNMTALADARAIEQMMANLQVVEVRLRKHCRQEYKHAVEDWRQLHTKHVIAEFVNRIQTTECAQPIECRELAEGLRKCQHDAAAEMATCLLHDVLEVQNLETPRSCQECVSAPRLSVLPCTCSLLCLHDFQSCSYLITRQCRQLEGHEVPWMRVDLVVGLICSELPEIVTIQPKRLKALHNPMAGAGRLIGLKPSSRGGSRMCLSAPSAYMQLLQTSGSC